MRFRKANQILTTKWSKKMIHKGNLEITSQNSQNYKNLVEVTGDLYIYSNAELSAPLLESVGGDLSINSNAIEKFPNNVKIKCLREICGNIGRLKFELIDGIACAVLSTRSRDGLIIKRCRKSIFKNAALTGDVFFVASDKKNNAHGKTAKQALEELAFKGMDRNVDKYRNMPLNTKKTPNEWGSIYRIITGACQFGVELFKSEKKLKKSYTLEEILKETQGTFGYKRFKEIIRN